VQDRRIVTMDHHNGQGTSRPLRVEWSRDRWRHATPICQCRDPVVFEAAIKPFNFYHWPTHLTHLINTDFTVSYRDALDRLLRVRLNSILFPTVLSLNYNNTAYRPTLVFKI